MKLLNEFGNSVICPDKIDTGRIATDVKIVLSATHKDLIHFHTNAVVNQHHAVLSSKNNIQFLIRWIGIDHDGKIIPRI